MTDTNDFFTALREPCPHPEGTRIQITGPMPDEPDPLPIGAKGTVTGGNGSQLHVDWDSGRTLMLLVARDPYRVLPTTNPRTRRADHPPHRRRTATDATARCRMRVRYMRYCGGMKTLGGNGARSDGAVRYRQDVSSGGRIGILPATCKRGVHSLAAVGYDATETDGVLRVRCTACAAIPKPDHSWILTTTPPRPVAAELDDSAYTDITPQLIERPV